MNDTMLRRFLVFAATVHNHKGQAAKTAAKRRQKKGAGSAFFTAKAKPRKRGAGVSPAAHLAAPPGRKV
ncbi:MAG: hypothetical protein HPY66_2135 [Firmicutes bacterium]|nr:hypothetical protein [Bacillota bacterium]